MHKSFLLRRNRNGIYFFNLIPKCWISPGARTFLLHSRVTVNTSRNSPSYNYNLKGELPGGSAGLVVNYRKNNARKELNTIFSSGLSIQIQNNNLSRCLVRTLLSCPAQPWTRNEKDLKRIFHNLECWQGETF